MKGSGKKSDSRLSLLCGHLEGGRGCGWEAGRGRGASRQPRCRLSGLGRVTSGFQDLNSSSPEGMMSEGEDSRLCEGASQKQGGGEPGRAAAAASPCLTLPTHFWCVAAEPHRWRLEAATASRHAARQIETRKDLDSILFHQSRCSYIKSQFCRNCLLYFKA